MKMCLLFLFISLISASCTKENIVEAGSSEVNAPDPSNVTGGTFVSGWEQYENWEIRDSVGFTIYSFQRKASQLTEDVLSKGGAVITYSKTTTSDPAYMPFTKPILLPFYFLPPSEKVSNSFYWYDVTTPGIVRISYRLKSSKGTTPDLGGGTSLNDFKFRIFILTKSFLDSKGLDAITVKHHYTYKQLVQMLGVNE